MKNSTRSGGVLAVLVLLGAAELGATLLAARFVDRETTYPLYLLGYLLMGLPWLTACYLVTSKGVRHRSELFVIVLFALAMRSVFLVTEPVLSDDVYRYVWDGRVQHQGINPYLLPPESEELRFLRNTDYAWINNKDIPTIYPPMMQMAFFLATAVSESVFWMKAFFTLIDVALLFVLTSLLKTLGLEPARVVAYAWCPLVIAEVAGSGHNDVLAVLFLVAALKALGERRDILSISLLTFSGLAKLAGFALVPLFVRSVRKRALVAVPLWTVVFAWPYQDAGGAAFRGLTEYGLRWRGNDSLFHLLYAWTGSLDSAKMIVAALLVLLVLVLALVDARPIRSSYLTLAAILLLTTTVHPWYLLWIAPFLAIYPSPAWMVLTLSVALSYHAAYLARPGEPWEDRLAVKTLEYAPFFALALWSLVRRLRRAPRAAMRPFLGID